MRFQRPIKNRERLYSGVDPKIKFKLMNMRDRYDCSMSFIINTILGDTLNVKLMERYDVEIRETNRTKK